MHNIQWSRFIPMVVTGFRFAQSILLLQARVSRLETELAALKTLQLATSELVKSLRSNN